MAAKGCCTATYSPSSQVSVIAADMFNSPRPVQPYGGPSTASNGFGGSYVDENPLSSSAYDGLDPWSAAPSPSPTPMPPATSGFSSVIGLHAVSPVLLSVYIRCSACHRSAGIQHCVYRRRPREHGLGIGGLVIESVVDFVSAGIHHRKGIWLVARLSLLYPSASSTRSSM